MVSYSMPLNHRAHDHRALIERWRALVKPLRATMDVLWESDGFPVPVLRTKRGGDCGLYVSAGIHGDEAAGAWGLLDFIENNVESIAEIPTTIIPCLNPWGFINNVRTDKAGNDLNRWFLHTRDPRIKAWNALVDGLAPALSICFHEDFDSCGCYLYEHGKKKAPVGWDALTAAAQYIPPDPRKTIEGRRAKDGLIWIRRLPEFGEELPESIALHRIGSKHTLTIETPSEFDFDQRIAAHRAMAETAFREANFGA